MKYVWGALTIALVQTVLARGSAPAATGDQTGAGGYYRYPAIHGESIVFTAEGDLWRVGIHGGQAERLTSHLGEEFCAAFSPDGSQLAFSASYEGPLEAYVMSAGGGLPKRLTFDGQGAYVAGWTPDGKVLYSTTHYSTLPDWQLATVNPATGESALVPLSQASDGVFEPTGHTLFFTRQHFQGSSTKRYEGGTAQNLWRFTLGSAEAVPLTADFPGTSKNPMWWEERIYFLSDRDGTMNVWSMNTDGKDVRQQTHHHGWDVKWASLSDGRIAYAQGADVHVLELASGKDWLVPIRLVSDFDQEREKWAKKPMEYLTAAHLAPDGERLVLTARGRVFVAPVRQGRFVEATREPQVRFRQARFLPDGKSLLVLSDRTGEMEFEKVPANGVGQPEPLTHDGKVFRMDALPSPDGKWAVYQDKNLELWLLDLASKTNSRLASSDVEQFHGFAWSPDSQWLAYVASADNLYDKIRVYSVKDGLTRDLTSERVNSYSPAWSPDGKWLYFLSERHIESVVPSPWGTRQPEPFFNEADKLYLVSLVKGGRSPFEPSDELHPAKKEKKEDDTDKHKEKETADGSQKNQASPDKTDSALTNAAGKIVRGADLEDDSKSNQTNKPAVVKIDWDRIEERVWEVLVPPGNYSSLTVNDKRVFWLERGTGHEAKPKLRTIEITNEEPKPKTVAEDIKDYELSDDGKKLLIHKDDDFYVVAAAAEVKLEKPVNLKDWTFPLEPRREWQQMFVESWRLMRDYFYDRNMHGVDWTAMRDKYLPLAGRVTDRTELNDLIADMVGELSALHIFVRGGDFREGTEDIQPAGLGAVLVRDEAAGGYRVDYVYQTDPDYPKRLSPLARPAVDIRAGAIIQAINGVSVLSDEPPAALLRNRAGKQVLLTVKASATNAPQEVIVKPMSLGQEADLRYDDWEYTRRLKVEQWSHGDIGYVHLRAMGAGDIAAWAMNFYPVFNRKGLIVDVRHNRGGNIDSWILEKLLRKAWFYWKPRVGKPIWNMQYAFRGHVVALCDEHTASDGEAFSEGFKRLGVGKVLGTRTWGGEIWLSFDNWLVDHGIASAAETGVYGPEGKWLIEGHGVDPDITVDNLPHATFLGEDAQLKAAVDNLEDQIRLQPVTLPAPPTCPIKTASR